MLVKRKRRKGPGQEGLITASPFLMPSLIGLLVFSLLPLLISAFISLTDWNGLDQLTAPGFFQEHFIGLDNYKAILSSPEFWGVLWNTFRYIIMYIPLMLVASLGVAYLLSRQRPGVTAFRIIYYIPVLTSWVAASMIWKSMLSPEYGAVNNILAVFGIQGPGWLLDEAWAMPAIVLVSVWKDKRVYFYSSSAYQQSIHQGINLPNGTYTVQAWIKVSNTAPDIGRMEATGYGGDSIYVDMPYAGTGWRLVETDITVTTGYLDIGLYCSSLGGTTVHIDNVKILNK